MSWIKPGKTISAGLLFHFGKGGDLSAQGVREWVLLLLFDEHRMVVG
jgi:hypothetical protein